MNKYNFGKVLLITSEWISIRPWTQTRWVHKKDFPSIPSIPNFLLSIVELRRTDSTGETTVWLFSLAISFRILTKHHLCMVAVMLGTNRLTLPYFYFIQARTSENAWKAQRTWIDACGNGHHLIADISGCPNSAGRMEETTLQIIFGNVYLFVIMQNATEWKTFNVNSCFVYFKLITLLWLWVIPILFSLKSMWWRFIVSWLIFSCLTGLVMRRAMMKPVAGTTPRYVYNLIYCCFECCQNQN